MNKRLLFPLFAFVALILANLACVDGVVDPNSCNNVLSGDYNTQECANVRALEGNVVDTADCETFLSDAYNTPTCEQYRIDNPPVPNVPDTCATCETSTSGGHVMDPGNVVQGMADGANAIACNDVNNPNYNAQSCTDWRWANNP
jgi:hypothetical protein